MKFFILPILLMSSTAFAAFSLDSIIAISCLDAAPTSNLDVYFSTDSSPARKYERLSGEIPFAYGNIRANTFDSGVMTLVNNPDEQQGLILLFSEDYYTDNDHVLKLEPTAVSTRYKGTLSGHIENINGDWVSVKNRGLTCSILWFPQDN